MIAVGVSADLIRAIDAPERIAKAGAYGGIEMNRTMTPFEDARKILTEMLK